MIGYNEYSRFLEIKAIDLPTLLRAMANKLEEIQKREHYKLLCAREETKNCRLEKGKYFILLNMKKLNFHSTLPGIFHQPQ